MTSSWIGEIIYPQFIMNNLVLDTWQLKSTDYYIEHDSIMKLAIIRKILATDTLLLARELRDVFCEMKICFMFHLNQSHAICKIWTISCRSRGVELSNSVPKYVITRLMMINTVTITVQFSSQKMVGNLFMVNNGSMFIYFHTDHGFNYWYDIIIFYNTFFDATLSF